MSTSLPVRWLSAALALTAGLFVAETALPLLGVDGAAGRAEAAANPFRVEVTSPDLAPGASGVAEVRVVVPEGFHVYRDMLWVKVLDEGSLKVGEASFPPGLMRPDPASPGSERELYDMDVIIHVPVTAPSEAGSHIAQVQVGYQGCKGGLCYMPAKEEHDVVVRVAGASSKPPAQPAPKSAPPADKADASTPGWRDGALVSAGHGAASAGLPTVDFSGLPDSASVQKVDAEGKAHPVHARLLLDHDTVAPGETVRLGLHLTQKPGWHTYWRSPGDIGLPTDITWQTPPGATTTPYIYPVPHRYDVEGIISYGYDDQVLLFTELTLPESLPEGEVVLGATAKWLVCEVMCIPGEAELSLPVTVAASKGGPNHLAPLFDAFAAQHPVDPATADAITIETALSTSAVQADGSFRAAVYVKAAGDKALEVPIEAASWPAFTPIVKGDWMVENVGVKEVDGGLLAVIDAITFAPETLPEADLTGGLVQVKVDGEWVRTEVVLDLPWAAPDAAVTANPSPLFALYDGEVDVESVSGGTEAAAPSEGLAPLGADPSFAYMLLLALGGGAILNIMPCVLPVLTLKLYSVVDSQEQTDAERRGAGLAYTAGVVASFWVLAGAVVLFRSVLDLPVGWGFQFQYPEYVAGLATIVFLFGLSLFGVFEVPAIGANSAAEAQEKEGWVGHFLTGTFTTLLATPCSAPLLGTGMGFAFGLPAWGIFLFFTVAAIGLASPFLLIAFVPALMRFLPRPGLWMETFKQLMGFTLIATTVWLVDVMGGLVGADGMIGFLAFLVAVGLGSWIFGRYGGPTETTGRQVGSFAAGVVVSVLAGWQLLTFEIPDDTACADTTTASFADLDWSSGEVPWQAFSESRVEELDGHAVFIDFTADWCLTCKVNEKTILSTQQVKDAMQAQGVVPLKADWTRKDEVITAWLQRYGKAGVPFYLVVPRDRSKAPIPLPEVITPDLVTEALERAAS